MAEIEGHVKDEELDPEQQARRRLALAQIRQYPDAALKMAARPVEEFDDDLRRLVDRMKQLMVDANGIGLAATQVGVLQRLFVFQISEDETVALAPLLRGLGAYRALAHDLPDRPGIHACEGTVLRA